MAFLCFMLGLSQSQAVVPQNSLFVFFWLIEGSMHCLHSFDGHNDDGSYAEAEPKKA